MKISVIGQGYVGFALSQAAHKAGHKVIGIETDLTKILKLSNSEFLVTDDYSKTYGSEIVIITVPTPLSNEGNPDLSFIVSACISMRQFLAPGTLIINESTSFPGTLRKVISQQLGPRMNYAAAPERIDPGNPRWNISNTPRIVGALSDDALRQAVEFYESFTDNVIKVDSPEIAEAAKLFENTFRAVNIALVTEFADIMRTYGISTDEVLAAAETKPFGFMKFSPSVGVGGHCIPVDPYYLVSFSKEAGFFPNLIDKAISINKDTPNKIARVLSGKYNLKEISIQIAGISYKADSDDVRESPAIILIKILRELGAKVTWSDELVKNWNGEKSTKLHEVDLGLICAPHSYLNFADLQWRAMEVINLSTHTIPNTYKIW